MKKVSTGKRTSSATIFLRNFPRLVSCTAKNHFYRANRDLGRIFKTEFLLSYLSEPRLRARIRRGLLKVEQLHALAKMGIPEGEDIDISLLEHVSPIEWENVILYGQYVLNPDDIR
jgi:Tn3 transposase DDE domain